MNLSLIQKIASQIAGNYTFGHYDKEDMEQEAILFALQNLDNYDPIQGSFENYMRTIMLNHLRGLKRTQFYRKTVCKICHQEYNEECSRCRNRHRKLIARMSLLEPHSIIDNLTVDDNTFDIEIKEIQEIINQKLPIHLKPDYYRYKDGAYLTQPRKARIEHEISLIINEYLNG